MGVYANTAKARFSQLVFYRLNWLQRTTQLSKRNTPYLPNLCYFPFTTKSLQQLRHPQKIQSANSKLLVLGWITRAQSIWTRAYRATVQGHSASQSAAVQIRSVNERSTIGYRQLVLPNQRGQDKPCNPLSRIIEHTHSALINIS